MRSIIFAKRTVKEIIREPLSYIFCLGFPIIMLIVMTIVNKSIPAQAGMDIFSITKLAPGMAFFGFSFVMIFAAIQVSTDRSTSLIMRLHASPMKPFDFIAGYTMPMFVIAIIQSVICYAASFIVSAVTGSSLPAGGCLLSIVLMLPGMLLFISLGLLFGTIFSEKAAPGICSVIVTVSGMLGGIWMPVESMGGAILSISRCMPFYYGVKAARSAVAGDPGTAFPNFLITLAWAAGIYLLAVFCMGRKLKKDIG